MLIYDDFQKCELCRKMPYDKGQFLAELTQAKPETKSPASPGKRERRK
jgi:hypothetical protein